MGRHGGGTAGGTAGDAHGSQHSCSVCTVYAAPGAGGSDGTRAQSGYRRNSGGYHETPGPGTQRHPAGPVIETLLGAPEEAFLLAKIVFLEIGGSRDQLRNGDL